MGRKMNKAPTHAFRAVVVWRNRNSDVEQTEYLGPYWRKSDATGRLTAYQNQYSRGTSYRVFVRGHVESAQLGNWSSA